MAKKTSTDADTTLCAYKFRLDPNQAQASALAQCAGAARYAYNLLTAHNLDVSRARADYWHARIDAGADETTVKVELKALAKSDATYKSIGYAAYGTQYLTPEINRHRAASKAIESGTDPAAVWPETERSSEPWLHTIPRRVLVSGLQSADKAWKNFFDSRTGARAGRLVGTPRFKRKGVSRDSFTIPAPETIGAYGTAYLRGEPEYARRKAQLKRRGIKTAPTIEDYRHVRLSHLGVIRTHDTTKPLVKAVRAGAQIRSYTVSRTADRWYVSILVELTCPSATPHPCPAYRWCRRCGPGRTLPRRSL